MQFEVSPLDFTASIPARKHDRYGVPLAAMRPCRQALHGAAVTPAKLLKMLLGAKFASSVICGGRTGTCGLRP